MPQTGYLYCLVFFNHHLSNTYWPGRLFVKVIKFLNEKTILDRERNEKLNELIKVLAQGK
ncbi:hypothetical protein CVD19_15335 [Bacillus sp. T33-2]|nr:hypothetical protein CVD19_15335 [Bacillus sp. T33-2]